VAREEIEVAQPDFGIRIKNLRRDNNLSQRELADLVGRTEDFINKIERNKSFVSRTTLERLAKAFRVPLPSLLDFSRNKEFVNSGGLKWRASRTPPALIVRHKKVHIRVPKKSK
jgi:transcriptional regulator with XRE-family HTH domain